jgi:hypothetical protein
MTTQNNGFDWEAALAKAQEIAGVLAPVIEGFAPETIPAVEIISKILNGVVAGVPTAKALWDKLVGGETVTPQELNEYAASYESSYEKLVADAAANPGT